MTRGVMFVVHNARSLSTIRRARSIQLPQICADKEHRANQNSLFRSPDWFSANQEPEYPGSSGDLIPQPPFVYKLYSGLPVSFRVRANAGSLMK